MQEKVKKTFAVTLPKEWLDELDELIRRGVFTSYAEAIRKAIEELLKRYGKP